MNQSRRDRDERRSHGSSGHTEDSISRSLKRVYDEIADEPIPDSLQSLLDRLKKEGHRG